LKAGQLDQELPGIGGELPDLTSDLVDVRSLPLDDLVALRGTVLAASLERVLAEIDSAELPVTGFNSSI
jgi:FXSXX-COOH protein